MDRLTGHKRASFFRSHSFESYVGELQRKNKMNSLRLITDIPKGLRRIERFDLPPREIALRKALFVSRRSAKLADAAMDAHMGIGAFERMGPKERAALWDEAYDIAITFLRGRPQIRDDPELAKQIALLRNFFLLPMRINGARERHWKRIERVEAQLDEKHADPEANYRQELDRLAQKAGGVNGEIKVLAMDICVASSIYADMKSRRGPGWSDAYQDGMEMAYAKLEGHPELVEAIAAL